MCIKVVVGMQSSTCGIEQVVSREVMRANVCILANAIGSRNIVVNGKIIPVKYVPTGVINANCKSIISAGVTFNPESLQREIDYLKESGITTFLGMSISLNARIKSPKTQILEYIYIAAINAQNEGHISKEFQLCNRDLENLKMGKGLRVFELMHFNEDLLLTMQVLDRKQNLGLRIKQNYDIICSRIKQWSQVIFSYVNGTNTEMEIAKAIATNENIVVEAGTILSQDDQFGYFEEEDMYPNCTAMGLLTSAGLNVGRKGFSVIGVVPSSIKTIDFVWIKYATLLNEIDKIVICDTPDNIILAYQDEDTKTTITEYSPDVAYLKKVNKRTESWCKLQPVTENKFSTSLEHFINMSVERNYYTEVKVQSLHEYLTNFTKNGSAKYIGAPYSNNV